MSKYTNSISKLEARYERKLKIENELEILTAKITEENEEFASMLEALEYIGTVTESRANEVLDFITGVINNTLAKIFPFDKRAIKLERTLYREAYTHINIKLITGKNRVRDLGTQSGMGLRQIISFLFSLTLIEVRKDRKILISDELLNGVHASAKRIMGDIIQMFAEDGFQFIMVEYGLNDIGKIYLVEKPGEIAKVTEFQGTYTDDIIFSEELEEELGERYNEFMPSREVKVPELI